jgi:colanic acid/amylovoran biosynthesis glycosyltransferase
VAADPADYAGRFLIDTVEQLRARGITVDVLAPGRGFSAHGLADGPGVAANARRRPWLIPPLLASMSRAARQAARRADLVHANWLQNGFAALGAGKPFVVTLLGSDVALAERTPPLARPVLHRARVAIGVSRALTEAAVRLGASDARFIPNGVSIPPVVEHAADTRQVLFAGRLSPEKGSEDLLAAGGGLDLTVLGDGPLRPRVPRAMGMVPREELHSFFDRAAVVVFPSRRDGFPVTCAEAMARGRAVVATAVGGLPDMVVEGKTGLLVPPGDPIALRAAIDRLLDDANLRKRLGQAAREHIAALCSWDAVVPSIIEAYEDALDGTRSRAGVARQG